MLDELILLSNHLTVTEGQKIIVAYHAGRYYDVVEFHAAVAQWSVRLQRQSASRYALYTIDAYPFAVLLMALFHAGKEVWIPGNNLPSTAAQLRKLDCRLIGEWNPAEPFDYGLNAAAGLEAPIKPLSLGATRLILFTSGSTGQAKPVEKRLSQLEAEIASLETQWGGLLNDSSAVSTVSHQHIYGLLFRVLWPLSAGRCFHSSIYIDPDMLLSGAQGASAYWVASPAHLKRLSQDSPWQGIAGLKAIFSSGGPLRHNAAEQILTCGGQSVIEIYGSTETGGIAWRRQDQEADAAWKLFEGVRLTPKDEECVLNSPYLIGSDGLQLDDRICLHADGTFLLLGRRDRIVKIEEKRLSLTEMELRLQASPWIVEAYALMLAGRRDVVGVAAVLSEAGGELLQAQGRHKFIKQLRWKLSDGFDSVVLPRKWLFLNRLPLTSQGKIDHSLIMQLLQTDTRIAPLVFGLEMTEDKIELHIKVPAQLTYFPDHFSVYPILPGVVQIAWAERFGKLFFPIDQPFLQMEAIKFVKIIHPGDELKLSLEWKHDAGKLYFMFSSRQGVHGSGRLVYGARP